MTNKNREFELINKTTTNTRQSSTNLVALLGMLSVTQEEEEGCQGDAGEPGGQGRSPPDSWHTSNVMLSSGGRRSYGGLQQSKGAPPPANMVEKGNKEGTILEEWQPEGTSLIHYHQLTFVNLWARAMSKQDIEVPLVEVSWDEKMSGQFHYFLFVFIIFLVISISVL